ncbi:MAG: hypothetical protein JXA43_00825 [Candidatus Diapherotrites archaeon]|nr:hypothetical protein [Candidatus Diapherotrites archaeon]
MKTIIDSSDIIKTYSRKDQESCALYFKYKALMKKHPKWGYKKLSKEYNIPVSKARWWHHTSAKPRSLIAVAFLESKKLLPLKSNDKHIPLIARILGCTFGDGGIPKNKNNIFLSSSEKNATFDFKKDLIKIFGNDIASNFSLIEGGQYGHSWCIRNSNRAVIRFFEALGAPIGNKSKLNLVVPEWLNISEIAEAEFYSAFFGNEIGIPKIHKQGNRLDFFGVAIAGTEDFKNNRIKFMKAVQKFLTKKGINTTKIYVQNDKKKQHILFKLGISIEFGNVMRFIKRIPLEYCHYKQEKLETTMKEYKKVKQARYTMLRERGLTHNYTLTLLRLNPTSFSYITDKAGAEVWS